MSFFDWVRQKLFGKPPDRKITRLKEQGDSTLEVVDRGGGPLRPKGKRVAHRDARLWPKARAPLGKRPKVMAAAEADGLFNASLRTRNRKLRDLLWDREQLTRLGLPLWETEEQLAQALGLKLSQLRAYASFRLGDKISHYVCFAIPKANGSERLILAPKKRLKQAQRKLLDLCLQQLPLAENCHGFRPGRSVATAARPHVGQKVVVRFDLADFFPSCSFARVRGLLIGFGYSYPVATRMALLATESVRQPVDTAEGLRYVPVGERHCVQGAPTSPALANALACRLDRRLAGLAKRLGFVYTRYADDLTFSSHRYSKLSSLQRGVRSIVEAEGFALRPEKTKVMRKGRRQSVLGVTVNQEMGLSRKQRRQLRAALHQGQEVTGKLAYLQMLNPKQAEALRAKQKFTPGS